MLKPTLVSSLRIGYIRHQFAISRYGDGFDELQLGLSSSLSGEPPCPFFPQIAYTDYTTFGNTGSTLTFSDPWSISETLNQVVGKHSMKFGGEFRAMFNNQQNPTSYFGNLSFNKGFTQRNPLASTIGASLWSSPSASASAGTTSLHRPTATIVSTAASRPPLPANSPSPT